MKWNSPAVRIGLNLGLGAMSLAVAAVSAGCGAQQAPLQVEVTQLAPYTHAAKAPDCQMPVLEAMPLQGLTQIAIVEAWAGEKAQPPDVLPALQRKACETGADAIVVLTSRAQTSEDATGYYIDSVAIVYGKENPTAAGTAYKIPKIPQGN
jgi:hypothetical protein